MNSAGVTPTGRLQLQLSVATVPSFLWQLLQHLLQRLHLLQPQHLHPLPWLLQLLPHPK